MWPTRAETAGEAAGSAWAARAGGETDIYLRTRQEAENFPVALRALPAEVREHLHAVYDVTRVIDDLGDEAPGDRTALLTAFRADLGAIWAGGEPQAPVLRRLAGTVRACDLSRQPFDDLVEANLRDQTTSTYATYDDLLDYCALSANPVGLLVLEVFGVRSPARVALSDRICTALQVIEHSQDVGEDRRAGRVYLPLEDLDRFGVALTDLDAATTSERLGRLVAFEAERAEELLASGLPLLGELRGWARLAVAGYVAGGRAAVTALRRADWAVLPAHPPVRRRDVLRELVSLATARRGAVA
jgi:squalene synthase HpnC